MKEIINFFIEPYQQTSTEFIVLEAIAVVFGIASVVFAKKNSIWVFPTGIISTIIFIYITFVVGYYGDVIINIYYTLMSVYGWILWSGILQQKELEITYATKKNWLNTFFIFIGTMIFVVIIYLIYSKFEDWTNYVDVLTTGLAFGSMWLMAKRKVENWLGWIVTDIISVPLYLEKGLGFTAIQFFVFLILATLGYFEWKKLVDDKQNSTKKSLV